MTKQITSLLLVFATTAPSLAADVIPRPRPVTPPSAEAIEKSILRGVDFLVKRQNKDGSWGTARRTKGLNIGAAVPGTHLSFRAATTSLAVLALLESGDGRAAAVDRGEAWLLANLPHVRRGSAGMNFNVWAHAYGIQALARMHARDSSNQHRRDQIVRVILQQIDMLKRTEYVGGGWGYYNFDFNTARPVNMMTSFTSATVLIALADAQEIGIEVPTKLTNLGVAAVQRMRKPDFSYLYHEGHRVRPMSPVDRPGGSLGRSQVCNLALRIWGNEQITDQVMIDWLDRLFARNMWLDIGRKRPVPHESYFQVAGYFYYYGHYYAARCIEQLPADQQPRLLAHLASVLMRHQDGDGSWWDFPLYDYHQPYGTSFAIMSLVRCRIPSLIDQSGSAAAATTPRLTGAAGGRNQNL